MLHVPTGGCECALGGDARARGRALSCREAGAEGHMPQRALALPSRVPMDPPGRLGARQPYDRSETWEGHCA